MMRYFQQLFLVALAASQLAQTLAQDCYSDLDTIFAELSAETVDLEAKKRFVLCPDTVFSLGLLENAQGAQVVNGESPLVPRSNTEYSCGEDGKSSNNCVLRGGDYGVLASSSLFFEDAYASNVVFKGLTFEGQIQSAAAIQQAGDFHFEDCIVQEQNAFAPVLINYEGNETQVADPTTAAVYFKNSLFQNNGQRTREVGVEFGVVTILGTANAVEVDDCIFQNNIYGDFTLAPVGYAISVSGKNSLVLKNSCISGNSFLGGGPIILNPDAFFVLIGNYADADDFLILCQFAAWYPTIEDRDNLNPRCVETQVDTCGAMDPDNTVMPTNMTTSMPTNMTTSIPTNMTTFMPTNMPTSMPTNATQAPTSAAPTVNPRDPVPTVKPTVGPTREPTRSPTRRPTRRPTREPTRRPTRTPTRRPTRTPTRRPTGTPTRTPTRRPTRTPTREPTRRPTPNPTEGKPTPSPTRAPTPSPTQNPTQGPDTPSPTDRPDTPEPTNRPDTPEPTNRPDTPSPTNRPDTPEPTNRPDTPEPTAAPVFQPTFTPRKRILGGAEDEDW